MECSTLLSFSVISSILMFWGRKILYIKYYNNTTDVKTVSCYVTKIGWLTYLNEEEHFFK